jgi:hypothetical protein
MVLSPLSVDLDAGETGLISLTRQGQTKLAETDALWAHAQSSFEAAFGTPSPMREAMS